MWLLELQVFKIHQSFFCQSSCTPYSPKFFTTKIFYYMVSLKWHAWQVMDKCILVNIIGCTYAFVLKYKWVHKPPLTSFCLKYHIDPKFYISWCIPRALIFNKGVFMTGQAKLNSNMWAANNTATPYISFLSVIVWSYKLIKITPALYLLL